MRRANCPGLLDAVLAETIPMHGRMIHGVDAKGAIYEESQEYDIHGRVGHLHAIRKGRWLLTITVYTCC